MPKKIEDVVIPERRKSIRNIPIPASRYKDKAVSLDGVKKKSVSVPVVDQEVPPVIPPRKSISIPSPHHSRRNLWLFIGAVLVLAFALLSMFDGATLTYTPKFAKLSFNNEIYSAVKSGEGDLLYSVVKLSGDKGLSVPASGEQEVSRKASGVIIVYNDASTEPQRLIENTRFESPEGKIYRIKDAISIPGKKTVSGVSQPGSLEVTVYADAPGEDYNGAPTDFTVPGLKGSARYTTIYARSKTAFTGGFIGKEKVVSDADLLKAKSDLRALLTSELTTKAQAEVPADFIFIPTLTSIAFEDLPQSTSTEGGRAQVNLRGSLNGVMFKKSDLARALAKGKAEVLVGESVEINSYDNLKFSFSGTLPSELLSLNKINFKVEGNTSLVWRTDEVALRSDLKGRSKNDISSVLKNYSTISSASATIRPFWKTSFPTEVNKISIKKVEIQ